MATLWDTLQGSNEEDLLYEDGGWTDPGMHWGEGPDGSEEGPWGQWAPGGMTGIDPIGSEDIIPEIGDDDIPGEDDEIPGEDDDIIIEDEEGCPPGEQWGYLDYGQWGCEPILNDPNQEYEEEYGAVTASPTAGAFHSEEWTDIQAVSGSAAALGGWLEEYMDYDPDDFDTWTEFAEENWEDLLDLLDPSRNEYDEAVGQLGSTMEGLYEQGYESVLAREEQIGGTGFSGVSSEFFDEFDESQFASTRLGFKEDVYNIEEDWASEFWDFITDMGGEG